MEEPGNMCLGCDGHCCRLRVELTTYDIARISLFQNKSAFVSAAILGREDPAAFRAEGKMLKLIMRRKDGFCMFQDRDAPLKCTINDSKPTLCLIYPFKLEDGEAKLRDKISCPLQNRKRACCTEDDMQALEDYLWEWGRYFQIVSDWNILARGDETADEFLQFAMRETELESSALGSLFRRLRRPFLGFLRR